MGRDLKNVHLGKIFDEVGRILGQFRHHHLREDLTNEVPFENPESLVSDQLWCQEPADDLFLGEGDPSTRFVLVASSPKRSTRRLCLSHCNSN